MNKKQFEDDGVECINDYNYALLDTYYEFDGERIIEWNKHSSNAEYTDFKRIAEILNIKQMRLESLMKHREEIGKLFDRIDEQQATIDKQELRLQCLEEILELSENLNKSYREKLIDMNLKMMIDDEPFEFNKNCAKPYEIRSVSPNGVIRLGKKNYKAKWRMKDVREINNELPTREEFNRETYQKLRNKYHTKHWCGDDVLGRIIYNIYIGTFEEYI